MKTRITILLAALFVSFNISFAQQDEECMNNLSIFDSYVKSKRYNEAYEPWNIVRNMGMFYLEATTQMGEASYYPINPQHLTNVKWVVGRTTYVFAQNKAECY